MSVPTTWHDVDSAREQWRDAPVDDERLETLLIVAQQQVLAFGSLVWADGDDVPVNYRLAQLMQARNAWNAVNVDPSNGETGEGTFAIRPFPLDWTVKQMIRPTRGVPAVG